MNAAPALMFQVQPGAPDPPLKERHLAAGPVPPPVQLAPVWPVPAANLVPSEPKTPLHSSSIRLSASGFEASQVSGRICACSSFLKALYGR